MNVGDCESRKRNRDEFYFLFLFYSLFLSFCFYFSREENIRNDQFSRIFIEKEIIYSLKNDEYIVCDYWSQVQAATDILFQVIRVR